MPLSAVLLALALHSCAGAVPQVRISPPSGEITFDRIFSGEFSESGFEPDGDWTPDGKSLLTLDGTSTIVKTDAVTGKRKVIVSGSRLKPKGATEPLRVEKFWLNEDEDKLLVFTNSSKVWRQHTRGDYWMLDLDSGKLTQLGHKAEPSGLMFAKLSPDGKKAGFVQANDLYVQDLESGETTRLTKDGCETLINGTFDWVYEEELDLRDGWRWSPDSEKIAYFQVDSSKEPVFTLIDDTDSLYPTLKRFPYPKAGETNPSVRIGVVSADGGPTKWVDDVATSESGYIARMGWAGNSDELLYERLNRAQNKIEYKIAEAKSGKSHVVFSDEDAAWIDILDTGEDGPRWIDDDDQFMVLSEQSGWRHAYAISRDGKEKRDLTPGEMDVSAVLAVDEKQHLLYFSASPKESSQLYLYKSSLESPKPEPVTPPSLSGTNDYRISPSGSFAFHTHSSFGVPPERDLVSLPDHKQLRSFGDNAELKAKLKKLSLGFGRIVKLKTADGEDMDASLIFPPDFNSKLHYPLFFMVYGEPAGTTVHDAWEGFDYLFNQMIAQHGYIVASVDNRGTPALKGRTWRKSVYKKIGIVASADQAAAAKELSSLAIVDPNRVGIWGWSGGGSMTLNMLFRYPDVYRLGMSVAPVPDCRLYDTIYQERYMGTPEKDPEVYRDCSPITFAKQLKGSLLIVHGSGDDNVHYQGTERLINELVANNKPFQLMVYPNRTHAIDEGPGTTRHLYELLFRFLTTNMPGGPKER